MTDVNQLKLEADEVQRVIEQTTEELRKAKRSGIVEVNEVARLTEKLEANAERHAKLTQQIRDLEQSELQ